MGKASSFKNPPWSEQENETLRRAYTAESRGAPLYTVEDIADLFLEGRSVSAIRQHVHDLGIYRPALRFEEVLQP